MRDDSPNSSKAVRTPIHTARQTAERYLTAVTGPGDGAVERLRHYRACHPHVAVTPPHPVGGGQWRATVDGRQLAAENELSDLLDQLDSAPEVATWASAERDTLRRIALQLRDIRWRIEPPWYSRSRLWEAHHSQYGTFTAVSLAFLVDVAEAQQ